MIVLVHDVPGRMRFAAPRVKHDHRTAARLRRRVRSVDGVASAEVNPLTGSLIVRYDGTCGTRAAIVVGFGVEHPAAPAPSGTPRSTASLPSAVRSDAVAEAIANVAAERLAERTVRMAVAALI